MAVEIETVPVGNVGNIADTYGAGYGAVDYEYNIGKYEVTNAQYTEFLNAVATVGDPNGLYNTDMGSGWHDTGGITRSGSAGSYTYAVRTNRGDRPVSYVSWYDALRFCNWLTNGQPSGPQGNGTTETGSYTITGPTAVILPDHTALAAGMITKWLLTSEDEWYKAAYYRGEGTNAGYWDYPTQSDTAPTAELPAGTDMTNGSANYWNGGHLDTTYYTTEVGAYDAKPSDSAYDTFDQGGNVWEWNEALSGPYGGVLRGGAFNYPVVTLLASARRSSSPTREDGTIGFRVVQVPEPATLSLLTLGGLALVRRRKRGACK